MKILENLQHYKELIWMALFIVLTISLVIGVGIFKSHYEAKSWNKLTGGNATTWDAFFVGLRVDCVNKK